MEKRRKRLRKLGFVSHDELKDKTYGSKGTEKRDQYEKDLKIELIGDFLKMLRRRMNLTQEQLAKLMGTDKTYISKIENNLKETRLETVRKYLEALKVNKMSLRLELKDGKSEELQLI